MRTSVDLNADVAESAYERKVGDDELLIPRVSSVNIACGFHAGDPQTIIQAIELALKHSVVIGAHPSFDDREGFGRRVIAVSPALLEAQLEYQLSALKGMVEARAATLAHLKLHGALYHYVSQSEPHGRAALKAALRVTPGIRIIAQAGSAFSRLAQELGFGVSLEAFPDRRYRPDGGLVPRDHPDACLTSADEIAEQALSIAREGQVLARDGTVVSVAADTLCLHGDQPGAHTAAYAIREKLSQAGIRIAHL